MGKASVTYLPTIGDNNQFISLVPDGEYNVVYTGHQTHMFFNRAPKVVFWFRIVDMGGQFEELIPRYYNVKRFKGKPGKNGDFIPGRSSEFIRDYCRLFAVPIKRLDRVPLSEFKKVVIKVRTRTVARDSKQKRLPDALKYSVIDEVIGIGDM